MPSSLQIIYVIYFKLKQMQKAPVKLEFYSLSRMENKSQTQEKCYHREPFTLPRAQDLLPTIHPGVSMSCRATLLFEKITSLTVINKRCQARFRGFPNLTNHQRLWNAEKKSFSSLKNLGELR